MGQGSSHKWHLTTSCADVRGEEEEEGGRGRREVIVDIFIFMKRRGQTSDKKTGKQQGRV